MAKIQIKSEKLTPFGGIFSGRGAILLHIVFCNRPNPLGLRCRSFHFMARFLAMA